MGNCVHRCFGIIVDKRRRYLRNKYVNADTDFSIEFENLMDEEGPRDEMTRLLTEREKQLLNNRQFEALVSEQRTRDAELDAKLAQNEQEIAREEEAFFEAKREAAQIAKLNKVKETQAKNNLPQNGWVDNDEWDVAGGEDDFEIFLASVKARSLATVSQVRNGDGQSSSSSPGNAHTKDKSLTEGSSLDMEWDHEAGMSPLRRAVQGRVSDDSWSKPSTASPMHSGDLEWDPDFVSATDDTERTQLINPTASKQAASSSTGKR